MKPQVAVMTADDSGSILSSHTSRRIEKEGLIRCHTMSLYSGLVVSR